MIKLKVARQWHDFSNWQALLVVLIVAILWWMEQERIEAQEYLVVNDCVQTGTVEVRKELVPAARAERTVYKHVYNCKFGIYEVTR